MKIDPIPKPTDKCQECSCEFKTKYMIRVDYTGVLGDQKKTHWEATTRKSIVGWLKLILNEFVSGGFEDITIHSLLRQCEGHKEYWEAKVKKNKETVKENETK